MKKNSIKLKCKNKKEKKKLIKKKVRIYNSVPLEKKKKKN